MNRSAYNASLVPLKNSNLNTQFGIQSVPNIVYADKKLENINCIEEATEDFGGMYLGDIICAMKPEIIQNNGITAVLSCLAQSNYTFSSPLVQYTKKVPAKDSLDYPLNIHFDQTFEFIETMRKEKRNILIHCHAGISRSAAIVCAYLMRKNSWSCQQALNFLRKRRNRVKPNQNFLRILYQFESKCTGKGMNESQLYSTSKDQSVFASISQNYAEYSKKVSMRNYRNSNDISNQNRQNSNDQTAESQMLDSRNPNRGSRKRFTNIGLYSLKKDDPEGKNNEDNQSKKKQNKKSIGKGEKQNEKLSFGQQFKNKISSLLGHKTRKSSDSSQRKNEGNWLSKTVSIYC